MSVDLPEPEGPMTATNSFLRIVRSTPRSARTDLAAHVVLALEVAGDDDGVPGDIGRQHGHPLFGVHQGAGQSFRPISASICALARR